MTARSVMSAKLVCLLLVTAILAGCSPSASAGTFDCVPAEAKAADDLRKIHGASLLSDNATKEIGSVLDAVGKRPVTVLVVDEDGRVYPFIPAGSKARLCKFKFPLKAAEMAAGNTISIFRTTNPKFCWYDANNVYQCIEW